ncbi:hypothetical protein DVS77_21640 [Mycolicibacterium moriokaense]|nr:hypothetical protein DVS77_21640 [Mycolicibacterium moriokaense]
MAAATEIQPPRSRAARDIGERALTRANVPLGAAATSLYARRMRLAEPKIRVLNLINLFDQLATPHIRQLVFPDNLSDTACNKRLRELVADGWLEYVEESHPGGRRGGRSVNVFQLGPEGRKRMPSNGRRRRKSRTIKHHALALADVLVDAYKAERLGWLRIDEWAVEPNTKISVDGVTIEPDLYMRIELVDQNRRPKLWLEVDLGSETDAQIVDKLKRYAYLYSEREQLPIYHRHKGPDGRGRFPYVMFLAIDAERVRTIQRLINETPGLPNKLFSVREISEFPGYLRNNDYSTTV